MFSSLWVAKTGLDAQQTRMDVISNNLANANTTGYKSARASFQDLVYQNVRQPGAQTTEQTQAPSTRPTRGLAGAVLRTNDCLVRADGRTPRGAQARVARRVERECVD